MNLHWVSEQTGTDSPRLLGNINLLDSTTTGTKTSNITAHRVVWLFANKSVVLLTNSRLNVHTNIHSRQSSIDKRDHICILQLASVYHSCQVLYDDPTATVLKGLVHCSRADMAILIAANCHTIRIC